MKRPTFFLALALSSIGLLSACIETEESSPIFLSYYRPVYLSEQEAFRFQVQAPRALQDPGRIYAKDQLLIINERFKGFHLVDNSNPASPTPLLFLEVPGAVNMAMQGNYLYVDNVTDLITLDLSNLQNIREVNRQKGVFTVNQTYPPMRDVGFECADPKKGVVVGWVEAPIPGKGAECWR